MATVPYTAAPQTSAAPATVRSELRIERLYCELEAPLTNVLYRWLWNREDVRDVVQEAFLRLWRMRARVDWERAHGLVYRIALNLAASRRRSRKLWRLVGLDDAPQADREASAEAQLHRFEEEKAVSGAIDALPERQRRVLVLVAFSGLTYQEIADTLGISPGTVASRRNAAVRKVRQHMERWERRV